MSLWKKIRYRLEAAGLRLAAWAIPRLSRQTCRRLANALGELGSRLDRRGRAVALDNLRCAFGDSLTPAQRLDTVRASYRNFAGTMLDLLWSPALARPENRHWLRVRMWPGYAELLKERGAVFLTLHFGNWEYASLSVAWAGYPVLIVAEHFKNPALEAIVTPAREIGDHTIIAQENSMLRMIRTVKRGGYAGLLTDLTLRPGQASTVIRAFGLEICVSMLHAVLVQRAGAVLVPVVATPDADGGYTSEVLPPLEFAEDSTLQQIAQRCWDFYEPIIRRQPGLWLWPYKHFRYKPRQPDRDYPFYANESGAFEKLRTQQLP